MKFLLILSLTLHLITGIFIYRSYSKFNKITYKMDWVLEEFEQLKQLENKINEIEEMTNIGKSYLNVPKLKD